MTGAEERDVSVQDMLWKINSFSLNSQSYVLDGGAGGSIGTEESRTDSRISVRERIEVLLLYLQLIGVGTNYKGSKLEIQSKISGLLVKRVDNESDDGSGIVELEKEIAVVNREADKGNRDVFEPVFSDGDYLFELYNDDDKKIVVQYYVPQSGKDKEHDEGFYVYTPSGLRVVRASEGELGKGVLGVAYIGLGLIKILDDLYGLEYQEVLKHEVLHHQYPHEHESSIRKMTMNALPFPTRYQ